MYKINLLDEDSIVCLVSKYSDINTNPKVIMLTIRVPDPFNKLEKIIALIVVIKIINNWALRSTY